MASFSDTLGAVGRSLRAFLVFVLGHVVALFTRHEQSGRATPSGSPRLPPPSPSAHDPATATTAPTTHQQRQQRRNHHPHEKKASALAQQSPALNDTSASGSFHATGRHRKQPSVHSDGNAPHQHPSSPAEMVRGAGMLHGGGPLSQAVRPSQQEQQQQQTPQRHTVGGGGGGSGSGGAPLTVSPPATTKTAFTHDENTYNRAQPVRPIVRLPGTNTNTNNTATSLSITNHNGGGAPLKALPNGCENGAPPTADAVDDKDDKDDKDDAQLGDGIVEATARLTLALEKSLVATPPPAPENLTPEMEAERKIHQGFMNEALDMARLALRTNETPVGCVLVHKGKIIAKGMNATNITRNGTRHAELMSLSALLSFRPGTNGRQTQKQPKNVLSNATNSARTPGRKPANGYADNVMATWGDVDPKDGHLYPYGQKLHPSPRVDKAVIKQCVLYVTVEPCVMCASLLRQLGIMKVYFGAVNDKFGGTGGVFRIHLNSDPGRADQEGSPDGDGGNVESGYAVEGGWGRDEAVNLLRQFYVQENGRAPVPRKKEGRAARLAAMMEKEGGGTANGSPSQTPEGTPADTRPGSPTTDNPADSARSSSP